MRSNIEPLADPSSWVPGRGHYCRSPNFSWRIQRNSARNQSAVVFLAADQLKKWVPRGKSIWGGFLSLYASGAPFSLGLLKQPA